MKRRRRVQCRFAIIACLAVCALSSHVGAAEFSFGGQTLSVPEGFVVELVAGPPLVDRPITCDFDEQGRLYVADSSGSNDKVEQQLAERPHRIVRLEDTTGDGRFDRRTVFADRMMFPEGTLWHRGSLYVSAPPSIWKLTDTTGDGVADRREEWFAGHTLTGCANDLHGPYRGRDGWLYWCKGAFAEQTHDLPGRPGWKTRASHIFRARPDGTGIEPVMTGGMDNPVDVVFTPAGERIFCCTFLQHPAGGQRDGLIHALYGGVYGKVHGVLDGHPRTGELLPPLTHLGPAAPSGLHYYESAAWGDAWQGSLFTCCFNLRKVMRHELAPAGATFTTVDSDFLVSDSADFHPTDVIEDADGSLLVCDTGGWYKLCCPTSQLYKPNVLGAIYRIRRAAPVDSRIASDPRGLQIDWPGATAPQLAALLDDPRVAVRERAIEALALRGAAGLAPLRDSLAPSASVDRRRNAVWALCRSDAPEARGLVRQALGDAEPTVRQAAIHAASAWRDAAAVGQLAEIVQRDEPAVARAAAEALGRLGDAAAAEPLLAAMMRSDADRALEHSLIYALIELGARPPLERALADENPAPRRAALVALDQLPGGGLTAARVAPLLADADPALRSAAWWLVERRPEWGEAVVAPLSARLAAAGMAAADPAGEPDVGLVESLAKLARNSRVQRLLADAATQADAPLMVRRTALRSMAEAPLSALPDSWLPVLSAVLAEPALQADALTAVRSLPLSAPHRRQLRGSLVALAADESLPGDNRLAALEALHEEAGPLAAPVFDFLHAQLLGDGSPLGRSAAAGVLARAALTPPQRQTLVARFDRLDPLALSRLLPTLAAATEETQLAALDKLATNPELAALPLDAFTAPLAKAPEKVTARATALAAQLAAVREQQGSRLAELAAGLPAGDVHRGHVVYHSKKAACSTCHALGYAGGRFGPDLSKIGQIRTERDLLEAIVAPSASFVRSYEPVAVVTRQGRPYQGLIRSESAREIVLAIDPQTNIRLERDDIEELRPSPVSLMPQGYDKIFTPQELADLVAFLKSAR